MDVHDLSATLTVQLFKVSTNKDGGGRIQLDFGANDIEEIHKIQRANGKGGINFQLAMVPMPPQSYISEAEFEPDFNGEIHL